jgi:cytochrome bd-type quinol oxidase subunit 2
MMKTLETIAEVQYSFGKCVASAATNPENVFWSNLNANRRASAIKGCCLTIIFFILCFFLFTPTTFIALVESVLGGIAGAFVGSFLPMLCVIIYMEVIIPAIINLLVRLEKHHTKGSAISSAMFKYLIFFSCHVFYFPFVITPIINTVVDGDDFVDSLPVKIG